MRLEPATFAAYSWAAPGLRPDIDDPRDAIDAAAAILAADGAPGVTRRALFAYDHADGYADEVLAWASRYEAEADL